MCLGLRGLIALGLLLSTALGSVKIGELISFHQRIGTIWLKLKKIPTKNGSVECCPIYRHHLVSSHLLASWQEARKLLGAASNGTLKIALSNQYGKGLRPSMARKIITIITKMVGHLGNLTVSSY